MAQHSGAQGLGLIFTALQTSKSKMGKKSERQEQKQKRRGRKWRLAYEMWRYLKRQNLLSSPTLGSKGVCSPKNQFSLEDLFLKTLS